MRRRLWVFRISFRLLAFNVLLVFLPIAALLLMDTYERQLLRAQENSMVQQGRILAQQFSSRAERDGGLTAELSREVLAKLEARHTARFRIVDPGGKKLADSSRPGQAGGAARESEYSVEAEGNLLYRLASFPVRLYRRVFGPPQPPLGTGEYYSNADVLTGPEIRAALEVGYGAATRISTGGQRSVNLYSAFPILVAGNPVGVVLVSESTYTILQDLYALRLDMFRIFLVAVAAAVALSLVAAATISAPLRRLQARAREILDRRGRLTGPLLPSSRRDEIGDLERALSQLTKRLADHLGFVESFASDVAHELKNPLAAIRSAAELAVDCEDPGTQREFLRMILADAARMERLIQGVREISLIDSALETETAEVVDVAHLAASVVESLQLRADTPKMPIRILAAQRPVRVRVAPDRLTQVLQNLLTNAIDLPGVTTITLAIFAASDRAEITVCDDGPGIPSGHIDRVFDRFFSYRPGAGTQHTGLGLSIVKAIIERYGGSVAARNQETGGACISVSVPIG